MKKIAMQETARIHRSSPRLAGLAAAVALSLAGTNIAVAQGAGPWDYSANIGAVSNYVWRGVTQTNDQAAVQGGLDVAHESGFSAGTWVSNVGSNGSKPSYELDFYAGYDFTLPDENASLGLNTIYYAYPDSSGNIDFWEIGISGGYDFGAAAVSAGIQYTAWNGKANDNGLFAEGDLYYSVGLDVPLPQDFSFGVFGGYYDFDNDQQPYLQNRTIKSASYDYWHWGASISKDAGDFGTFSFTYEQVEGNSVPAGSLPAARVGDLWDQDAMVWVGWSKTF